MQGSLEQASSLQQSSGRRGRLWNNQNCLRRSSLFSLYAKIFRLLLGKWEPATLDETSEEDAYLRELDRLVLPSNEEWRLRVYYRLVELQRSGDSAASDDQQISMIEEQRQQTTTARGGVKVADWSPKESNVKWDWEPDERSIYPLTARSSRRLSSLASNASVILDCQIEPGWRLNDILLAARLLSGEQSRLNFTDEAEMRRVYGLVYDVLRYEFILNQALDEVGFWVRNSTLKKLEKVVWLLLYDMQGRKFSRPGSSAALAARNDALKQAGLWDVEKALLDMKTKLAASLSRLRIGGSALSLDELLPPHLRTAEGVTWGEEGSIASGWVNSVRLPSRKEFVDAMRRLGLRQRTVRPSGCCDLDEDQYAFDPLCPKVVNLHERARERLAVSQLVRGHCFVFLERSLCIGAAAMVQAIRAGKLCGPVVLTHPLAPRHTGYLAELLADVDEAGRLLVFGLGNERARHVEYLETLGISLSRCKLFTEKYTNAPSSPEIERATIVLATPPCSYTGVRDVVDLAIARGGDLRLLESLTSLESESPQQPRQLLAEQMATLRHALTKPNVQLLVYEVHTLLPSETNEMIEQAVDYANNLAIDKYRREHPHPKRKSKDGKKGKRKKSVSSEQSTSRTSETYGDKDEETIKVPDSDLFEMTNLSDIYNQDCQGMIDPGSFIVVVKRKEMMQFNSLFMIKVAEAKGVFGESKPPPTKSAEEPEEQAMVPVSMERTISRRSPRRNKPHIERLTVPTYATIVRVLQERRICTRHQQHLEHEASALEAQVREARRRDARRWWDELAKLWQLGTDAGYQFQALRTDPLTRKTLFPAHVARVTYPDSRRPSLAMP